MLCVRSLSLSLRAATLASRNCAGLVSRRALSSSSDDPLQGLELDSRVRYWAEKKQGLGQMEGREQFYHRPKGQRQQLPDDPSMQPSTPEQLAAASEVTQLGRQRRWQEALELFRTVSEPDPKLWTAMVDACAKSFEVGMARQMFSEMPVKTQ
ncbi:unnamed protein product, partial [Polarella glacialis]